MDISHLIDTFEQLVNKSQTLCHSLAHQKNKIWLPLNEIEQAEGLTPLTKAQGILQDFCYQNGQDGRETRSCFGLIAADEYQLNMATDINVLKESFKHNVKKLQKKHKSKWLDLKGNLAKHPSLMREELHFSGLSRLHLKQTWRHIPVIIRSPSRIGFNWYTSGRSIQKVTVEQATEALLKLDTSSLHIQTQLNLLAKLGNNTPLAKVQNLAPTMRANLFYDDQLLPERQAMNISLPILFKANANGQLPVHNEPAMKAPDTRQRAVRSDRKIEDMPFLPSIRVHRYCI